jgi:uncharacterized protein (TIGR00251 family)
VTARIDFAIKVHPRARRDAVSGAIGDALKVAVTEPPDRGRANDACLQLLAREFDVPRASVTILSGYTSPRKMVRIAVPDEDWARRRLGELMSGK